MLKNLSKEQLLEKLYELKNENYELKLCNEKQSEVLKDIAEAYQPKGFFARIFKFFALHFTVLQTLKKHNEYFYQLTISKNMNFTKQQIEEAIFTIAKFENKKISPENYKAFVIKMLGLKQNCSSCSDVTGRLHEDFQKRIATECLEKYPELLPTAPEFKSGKYCANTSDFYKKEVEKGSFKALRNITETMKSDIARLAKTGLKAQSELVKQDLAALENFIKEKKMGFLKEETTGEVVLENDEPGMKDAISDLDDVEQVVEVEKGVLSEVEEVEVKEEEKKEAEKPLYKDEDALELNKTMTMEEIGAYYGISAATVSRKLKVYKETLAKLEAEKTQE